MAMNNKLNMLLTRINTFLHALVKQKLTMKDSSEISNINETTRGKA